MKNIVFKGILAFLLIFFFGTVKSQSHRFIYEYRFVPDSTKTDSIITENTRLEIFKGHSEFLSDLAAKRDSAILKSAEKKTGEVDIDLPGGKFNNKVWKSKDKMYSLEFIGIESFKVKNNLSLDWKLSNETKIIQNYNCQKATLQYGNRSWEAWFTADIPIQDGPYIFRKLPGLIIQIQDTKGYHSFLLIGNFKSQNAKSNLTDKLMFKSYEATRLQFSKKWQTFRENPMGGSEQFMLMHPNISNFTLFDENGIERNTNDVKTEERRQAQNKIKSFNNFLDLDLYR